MIKKLTFSLYFIVTLILICATIIEKYEGTSFIQQTIYGAWWFYLCWAVMTILAFIYMIRQKLYKRFGTFLLHCAFGVILLGALTTALTAQHGAIYLPLDQPQQGYTDDSQEQIEFEFTITLYDLEVEYYSGTKAPADYISYVRFESPDEESQEARISMNRIAQYKGYRFYQSEYDKVGSVLSINRDRWGMPITYTGYFLLALSFIWILIAPNGTLRRLLRSGDFARKAVVVLLAITCSSSHAVTKADDTPKTLSPNQIEMLNDLQVVFNERVMPLTTLAHQFTLKLLEDTQYKGLSSEQFFWGWLLFPEQWQTQEIFEVPLSKKQEFLNLRAKSSYADFFTDKKVYKLNHYINNTNPQSQPALLKELKKLNEKVQLVAMLRSGAMIKLFPYRDSTTSQITWYSPIDELPEQMDKGQALFIKNSIPMLLEAAATNDNQQFELLASKILSYQQKYAEESLIPPLKVKAEQWYYSLSVVNILYRFNLAMGILGVILLVVLSKKPKIEKLIVRMLKCSMIHAVGLLALSIVLKWYITERVPLVNGYDTMIFLGWCVALFTLLISRSSALFTAMGTILVGFAMLVASLGGMNPQITPLMPVLNSPYLTTHVCFIMLSYTLFAFTFINGILAITIARKDKALTQRLTNVSRIFVVLGLAFLSVGIFIGAIWANVSWGRYWAWDPKEVWALITMLLYAIPLHGRSIGWLRRPKAFHIYLIIIFASVLMTYFGVNFILGGMHSYVS